MVIAKNTCKILNQFLLSLILQHILTMEY
jgi:hypothetical protein